jgi:uncharacterized membrane protein YdfJ with MMPL/SSD domain
LDTDSVAINGKGADPSAPMTSTSGAMQPLSEATTTISHQRSALSMDHHVFLLSRIRERYAQTGDNQEAVVHGIAATGRIIPAPR